MSPCSSKSCEAAQKFQGNSTVQSVYYLTHKDTGRRLKWYKSLTGARIAQRSRNHRLGFITRIERIVTDNSESELCVTVDNLTMTATYTIVEDSLDSALDSIVEHKDKDNG